MLMSGVKISIKMKKIIFLSLLSILALSTIDRVFADQPAKPRVIAMTDGEVDDRCSMIRFLLYSNDMDIANYRLKFSVKNEINL